MNKSKNMLLETSTSKQSTLKGTMTKADPKKSAPKDPKGRDCHSSLSEILCRRRKGKKEAREGNVF